MSGFRYFPGQSSGPRQFQGYNPRQEANWEILNRAYYSASFGYGHTQMAFPGSRIEPERYETWREKFLLGWKAESSRTPGTRGMDTGDFPEGHLRHIYLSMMEVEKAHPKALEVGEVNEVYARVYGRVDSYGDLRECVGIEGFRRNGVGDYSVEWSSFRPDYIVTISPQIESMMALTEAAPSGVRISMRDQESGGALADSAFTIVATTPGESGYEIQVDWASLYGQGQNFAPINAELIQCDCTPQHREPLIPLPDSGFSLH